MAGFFSSTKFNKIYWGTTPIKNAYLGSTKLWASTSSMYGKVASVNYSVLSLSSDYFASWTNYNNSENMRCICFSEDRFFIGAVGKILTFKDGVFSTVFTLPITTQSVIGITAYKKNIVAWYSSTTVVSTDGGATWSIHNTGYTGIFYANTITHDGTKFVGVHTGGYVVTSVDGKSWTTGMYTGEAWTRGIYYLNGRYYLVSQGYNRHKYSTDLVTWTMCATTIGESWTDTSSVAYSSIPMLEYINGTYVCVHSLAYVYPVGYATDGSNWTIKQQNYPIGGLNWICVNCGDRVLIVSKAFYASSGMSVWQTTNGIDYTRVTNGAPSIDPVSNRCVAYANE